MTTANRTHIPRWGIILTLCAAMLVSSSPAARAELTPRDRLERKMARLINEARRDHDRKPLEFKGRLSDIARRHSRTMRDAGTIFHSDLGDTVASFSWSVAGENVGMGPTIRSLHTAFMNSPGHRANVLYRSYTRVGVGLVRGDDGLIYVTILFLG